MKSGLLAEHAEAHAAVRQRKRGHGEAACRRSSNRPSPRPVDDLNHLIAVVRLEHQPRDRPHAILLDRLQKHPARAFRTGRRKAQDGAAGCTVELDRAERKARRDRGAENIGRNGTCLKFVDREFVGGGMLETVEKATGHAAEKQQTAKRDDRAPDRPQALDSLEMLHVVPAPVAPSPAAALGAEHERHDDDADERNEGQQGDIGVVADTPDPVEQERAPVPAV